MNLTQQVRHMRREGTSWRLIAKTLGLSEHKCRVIAGDVVKVHRKAGADDERVPRKCNKCGNGFLAPTRFIRTCDMCKKARSWRSNVMEPYSMGRRV